MPNQKNNINLNPTTLTACLSTASTGKKKLVYFLHTLFHILSQSILPDVELYSRTDSTNMQIYLSDILQPVYFQYSF